MRRRILWLVGAFVFYQVIRISIAAIAGSIAYQNLALLAKDGLEQTSQQAIDRINTAGQSAGVSHFMLADPLIQLCKGLAPLGSDLQTVDVLLDAANQAATPIAQLLGEAPASQKLSQLGISSFAPDKVFSSLKQLQGLAISVEPKLASIPAKDLSFGLAPQVDSAKVVLGAFAKHGNQVLELASTAAVIGRSGQQAPAYWFLANQNLAEARGTGGLIGSFAVIKVFRGKITLSESGSDQDLNALGPVIHSSLPLNTGIIWQDDPKIWQDLNPSAHLPYAAKQITDTWLRYKKQKLDGVLFMGQGIAQYMVAAVGPISVADNHLNGANTADFLAKGIYAKYPDVAEKNAAVQQFMTSLFLAVRHNKPNFKTFFASLANSGNGDRIGVWSANPSQQLWNQRHDIAGIISQHQNQDVTISVNNSGGNKLEAYLHLTSAYSLCLSKRKAHLDVTVANEAPRVGLPLYTAGRLDLTSTDTYIVGSNLETVTVYLPIKAQLNSLLVDGESMSAGSYVDRGHQILVFDIEINPQAQRTISLDWSPMLANAGSDNLARVKYAPLFNMPRTRIDSKACG